jgi:hypothetical protein
VYALKKARSGVIFQSRAPATRIAIGIDRGRIGIARHMFPLS